MLQRRGLKAPLSSADDDATQQKKAYEERTRAVLEILTHFEERYEEFQLAEALLEHDEYFSLWRSHHIKMVERMVGAKRGTGGSEGIGYLKTTLDKKFFPGTLGSTHLSRHQARRRWLPVCALKLAQALS